MTKHRSVVTGWDPAKVNPDGSTGRPKGVQTAADMRIHSTYDVLAEGIFAHKGVPAITGSPTNSASISPFMAAIAAPAGGFYVVSIDATENFTINLANVGAVKLYVQQEDYQVDNTKVDSNVVIGVVYGANPIPANSLLLFTTTITAQTSTNGLTFTPAFKYTGAASGQIRVPTQADLANVAVLQAGIRALVTTTGGGGAAGEYFYTGSVWQISTTASPAIDSLLTTGWIALSEAWSFNLWDAATRTAVITVPSGATSRYQAGNRIKFTQPTGGVKLGIIHGVASTALTVFLPFGMTFNNEAITLPFWSPVDTPNGFNKDPELWTLVTRKTTRTTQSAAINTYYNIGGSLAINAGKWLLSAADLGLITHTAAGYMGFATVLSTASSGTSGNIPDSRMRCAIISSTTAEVDDQYQVERVPFTAAGPTTIYMNRCANGGSGITLYSEQTGDLYANGTNFIKALSAYL
jgi:hypothetical protein